VKFKIQILKRAYIGTLVVLVLALTIISRLYQLSFYPEKEELFKNAPWAQKDNVFRDSITVIPGRRGNILSRDGEILAASSTLFDLRMDFATGHLDSVTFLNALDSISYYLARVLKHSRYTPGGWREVLLRAYRNQNRYFKIADNVSYSEYSKLRKLPVFRLGRYKGGFIAEPQTKRVHPFKMLALRTLGYVKDGVTKVGLEGTFDKELSANDTVRERFIQTPNGPIPLHDPTSIISKVGMDVVTTLDINLQDVVHNALLRALQYHDADRGTAILMDTKTGAIRAISNLGRVKNGWAEIYNYAVGHASEPGSTFKLASIIALLEDGYVDLDDSLNIYGGKRKFYDEEMVDASYHGFDRTTVRHAFEISSNVGIASLVDSFYNHTPKGRRRFVRHLKDLHLHLPTGIEIKGEALPFIKDPDASTDQWSGITLPWMAIGYEEKLTPLQLLTFYNAIANDGVLVKPYLVSELQKSGRTYKRFKPTIISSRLVSSRTLKKVHQLLEGVVQNGTAKKLRTDLYRFAGKTGTAQMNYARRNGQQKYQASFVGYFPAERPRYSCIVVIYGPKTNGYYGSAVAGPVFREIADHCFQLDPALHYPVNALVAKFDARKLPGPQPVFADDARTMAEFAGLPLQDAYQEAIWADLKPVAVSDSLLLRPRQLADNSVPDVRGMTLKDALYLLENRRLKVRFKGTGYVVAQSIRPGTAAKGQTIFIRLKS